MKRTFFIFCFIIFISNFCFASDKLVITVILSGDYPNYHAALDGFIQHLNDKNIDISINKLVLDEKYTLELLVKLNEQNPDVIFVVGTLALGFVHENIKDTPVVFCVTFIDEIEDSLRPNVTGIVLDIPTRLKIQAIREFFPEIKTFGTIYSEASIKRYQEAAEAFKEAGIKLVSKKIKENSEFPIMLKELVSDIDCYFVIFDHTMYFMQSIKYLLLESLRRRFVVIGLSSFFTRAGAVMSVDCDYMDLGKQAAELVLEINAGRMPNKIGIKNPRKVKISVNLTSIKRLNKEISPKKLKKVSEVFGR